MEYKDALWLKSFCDDVGFSTLRVRGDLWRRIIEVNCRRIDSLRYRRVFCVLFFRR